MLPKLPYILGSHPKTEPQSGCSEKESHLALGAVVTRWREESNRSTGKVAFITYDPEYKWNKDQWGNKWILLNHTKATSVAMSSKSSIQGGEGEGKVDGFRACPRRPACDQLGGAGVCLQMQLKVCTFKQVLFYWDFTVTSINHVNEYSITGSRWSWREVVPASRQCSQE